MKAVELKGKMEDLDAKYRDISKKKGDWWGQKLLLLLFTEMKLNDSMFHESHNIFIIQK